MHVSEQIQLLLDNGYSREHIAKYLGVRVEDIVMRSSEAVQAEAPKPRGCMRCHKCGGPVYVYPCVSCQAKAPWHE